MKEPDEKGAAASIVKFGLDNHQALPSGRTALDVDDAAAQRHPLSKRSQPVNCPDAPVDVGPRKVEQQVVNRFDV